MTATTIFIIILIIFIGHYLFDTYLSFLNAKWYKKPVPENLNDVYEKEEYLKSQDYKYTNYKFSIISGLVSFIATLLFLIVDGFAIVDSWARSFSNNEVVISLLFFGIIGLASSLLSAPFSYYATFVIEEKFGFNKTTHKTYFIDILKGLFIGILVGGGLLTAILFIYMWTGQNFWWYAWILITAFSFIMNMFYARFIVPLFNKQTPLENGSLRIAIEDYASKVGFSIHNIFVIDGSKRSTKANAYFSGFGSEKRITLYDTLIEELEQDEIVAVLAHEVGHYKRKHILYNLVMSTITTGITLFLFSLIIDSKLVAAALGVTTPSFHIGLIAFGLLYTPMSMITGVLMSTLSRKHEYEADHYAVQTFRALPLINALKKLSKTSLSNLTPHPIYEYFNYSHPSLRLRVAAMLKANT